MANNNLPEGEIDDSDILYYSLILLTGWVAGVAVALAILIIIRANWILNRETTISYYLRYVR